MLIRMLIVSFLLILLNSNAFASILIENGSYGEIFPAENGNMHILIRNDNSSYMYYSSEGIVKDVPLGVSDSSIFFETAFSDGAGGVYVLYNNTANKTLYAQRYSPSGEALWEAPGIMVDTYTHTIEFAMSVLTPAGDFIVIYDNYTPFIMLPSGDYDGYLRAISPDGVVSSPAGEGEFYHGRNIEIHSDTNALYTKRWDDSNIAPIFNSLYEPVDTANTGILEFDCDGLGFLFGIRRIEGAYDTLELHRFDDQLHALWETPIVFDIGLGKMSSDVENPRPKIIANNDGSVTLYPSIRYGDPTGIGVACIDSSGEYLYRDLDIGEALAAFNTSDGANLLLVNTTLSDGETDVVRLVKVSINGDILFSSILKYGYSLKGSIIENTDGSYATTMAYGDTVAIDKISNMGAILVFIKETNFPTLFSMSSAYPNPFNPRTQIDFKLPEAGTIIVQIYNLSGHLVKQENLTGRAGVVNYTLNASQMPSGVYLIKAQLNNQVDFQKVVLLK